MTSRGNEQALFEPAAGGWLPTALSRGPWSPDALHGGPVAALLAREVERAGEPPGDPDGPVLVRLTVELLRPVPFDPLTVRSAVVRPGRKVQLVDVTVRAGDMEVAWARGLRIRRLADGSWPAPPQVGSPDEVVTPSREGSPGGATAPVGSPGGAVTSGVEGVPGGESPPAIPGPQEGRPGPGGTDLEPAFHSAGAELRFVAGGWDVLGPATVWTRLRVPVVPGESPSGAQRAAAGADFGNGVSAVVPFDRWRFINPDLTVVLERPPEGEWVAVQATTNLGAPGVGVAQSVLWDQRGRTGTATQTLVVEPR